MEANRIRLMADYVIAEMAAGRVASGAQCRPAIKAKFSDATNGDCLLVAQLIASERGLMPANSNNKVRQR
jgi:hypothetical protein